MYLAFVDPEADVSPLLISSLSLFSKSCFIWNSIVYVLFNKEIFNLFFKTTPKQENLNKNDQSTTKPLNTSINGLTLKRSSSIFINNRLVIKSMN